MYVRTWLLIEGVDTILDTKILHSTFKNPIVLYRMRPFLTVTLLSLLAVACSGVAFDNRAVCLACRGAANSVL